jgi:hydroxycarboxylate dehydrogenase B
MLFPTKKLEDFAKRIFLAGGSDEREAKIVADHLVEAAVSGHDSHGVIRILAYITAIKNKELIPNQHPTVRLETDSMIALEGNHGYGQVVALEATQKAIAKANKSGIAMVTMRNAGHIGRLGAWAEMAAAENQATIYFVNAARPGGAQLAPFGGTDRRLNAGPICLGMPADKGHPIILDMSTAAVAMGKIRLARNKKEKLREACIVDGQGNLTDDPEGLYGPPPGAVLPFGGHKGSGLCMFTDLFGGILSGAGADYDGPPCEWYPINNMTAIHINVGMVADLGIVSEQVAKYSDWIRASKPQTPGVGVQMPGDYEWLTRQKRLKSGIEVDDATWKQVVQAAEMVGITKSEADAVVRDLAK